jgi:hypothetical protein
VNRYTLDRHKKSHLCKPINEPKDDKTKLKINCPLCQRSVKYYNLKYHQKLPICEKKRVMEKKE